MNSVCLKIVRSNSTDPDLIPLVRLLDDYLYSCYGEEQSLFDHYNDLSSINHVVIGYYNGLAAGCGGFKKYDANCMEIKRVFVREEYRRKGIGEAILRELETWAAEFDFETSILETGIHQPESIALYEKLDYSIIENYGQYAGVDISVCMKKEIG